MLWKILSKKHNRELKQAWKLFRQWKKSKKKYPNRSKQQPLSNQAKLSARLSSLKQKTLPLLQNNLQKNLLKKPTLSARLKTRVKPQLHSLKKAQRRLNLARSLWTITHRSLRQLSAR